MRSKYKKSLLTAVILLLAAFNASAQEEDDFLDDEIFLLSPFEVVTTKDTGYLSTNSVSGTSLNIEIKDLPMPLEVVNKELIEDLAATNLQEALAITSGVFLDTNFTNQTGASGSNFNIRDVSPSSRVNVGQPFVNIVSIRAYPVPNQQRFGFRVGSIVPSYGVVLGGLTDTVNVSRMEIVRGPAALLYGINVLSGVVNMIPEKPLSGNYSAFSMAYGSYDFFRAQLETTGPVIKNKLNYRVASSYQTQGDQTDFQHSSRLYGVGQVEWFITKNAKLFVEGQFGHFEQNGGSKLIYDDWTAEDTIETLRNKYNELYSWARTWPNADPEDRDTLVMNPDRPAGWYSYSDRGPEYTHMSDDRFFERDEVNFLGILTVEPLENLTIEAGVYYTDLDTEELNLNVGTITDQARAIEPGRFADIPELSGDMFDQTVERFEDEFGEEDIKFLRYWWTPDATEATSLQMRLRGVYTFDHELAKVDLNHTIIGGISMIEDEVHFIQNNLDINDVYKDGEEDDDALHLRNIFDPTPIQYDGGRVAIPGNFSRVQIGPDADTDISTSFVRSGVRQADLEYDSYYGIYQGRFWKERLTFIAGVRRDEYQVTEYEQLRVNDLGGLTENWQGVDDEIRVTDFLIGDGTAETYTPNPNLPDSLNEQIAEEYAQYRDFQQELLNENPRNRLGEVEQLFDDPIQVDTKQFSIGMRVLEDVNVFYSYAEGVFPNTGLRDNLDNAIEAEQTTNHEIGIKVDLFDGKISGTFSAFKLKRDNAVFRYDYAPNPAGWFGGANSPVGVTGEDAIRENRFDPIAATPPGERTGDYEQIRPDTAGYDYAPIVYSVAQKYIEEVYNQRGLEFPSREAFLRRELEADSPSYIGGSRVNAKEFGTGIILPSTPFTLFNYELLEQGTIIFDALELAMADDEANFLPLHYRNSASEMRFHNASQIVGGNVTYEEEATGYEGQFIFTIREAWQVILNYSHIEREVTGNGFDLAPAVDQRTGATYGTPYDIWVWYLGGYDSFEDPSDPTSTNGNGINGLNLSGVPEDSANFWMRYAFRGGSLEGLAIAGGFRWVGSALTTNPIGGTLRGENRFATPDTAERVTGRLNVTYRKKLWGINWKLSLNVNNLFNDTYAHKEITYDYQGSEVFRRWERDYTPRTYKVTLSADF